MDLEQDIIKIQKIIRGFLIRNRINLVKSQYQTKMWRKNRRWYINGKYNECETYQLDIIHKIIQQKCIKTFDRINYITNEINCVIHPLLLQNGFDFTENFDGIFKHNYKKYYINLKFVCDNGGAQTRSLREVYHFINSQKKLNSEYYFINILDGDCSFKHIDKFKHLNENNVFIGDLYEFENYYNKFIK